MRSIICMTAALAICAGATPLTAKTTKSAAFQINETSWLFTEHGKKNQMSIDANGNYIENAVSGKHVDHGTAVMKGAKVCFTSAMDKKGEMCWTTRPTSIGHSMVTVSDKGEKLKVTRVKYAPLKMPS